MHLEKMLLNIFYHQTQQCLKLNWNAQKELFEASITCTDFFFLKVKAPYTVS